MNPLTQRISAYASGGAVGGSMHSLLSAGGITDIFLSLAVGFVAGAAAGAAASVPLPKISQGLFVGAAAGLCVGLSWYLLGAEKSLAKAVFLHMTSLAGGGLVFRCLLKKPVPNEWFAAPPDVTS